MRGKKHTSNSNLNMLIQDAKMKLQNYEYFLNNEGRE